MRHDTEGHGALSIADPMVIPTVTAAQMREVDRFMVEELHIGLLQMMENAGRALAALARRALRGDPCGKRVVVLAGRGGNGGGGLAAARRLSNWGARVSVVLARPPQELTGVAAHQFAVLERMGIDVRSDEAPIAGAEIILDALVGYDLHGEPHGRVAELIRAANAWRIPIVALDLPSGLDPDTGEARDPTIRAMRRSRAGAMKGRTIMADIKLYGPPWCPDCKRSKKFLAENRVRGSLVPAST